MPQATNVPPGVSERNEAGSPSPWVVARAWMAEWVEGGREGGTSGSGGRRRRRGSVRKKDLASDERESSLLVKSMEW